MPKTFSRPRRKPSLKSSPSASEARTVRTSPLQRLPYQTRAACCWLDASEGLGVRIETVRALAWS